MAFRKDWSMQLNRFPALFNNKALMLRMRLVQAWVEQTCGLI